MDTIPGTDDNTKKLSYIPIGRSYLIYLGHLADYLSQNSIRHIKTGGANVRPASR